MARLTEEEKVERKKLANRKYYEANKDKVRACNYRWKEANKERYRKSQKEYYNRERLKKLSRIKYITLYLSGSEKDMLELYNTKQFVRKYSKVRQDMYSVTLRYDEGIAVDKVESIRDMRTLLMSA